MPTAATRARDHQKRWQEIGSEPLLSELPYKVETNHRGQIVLSPHQSTHSFAQGDVMELLYEHAEGGHPFPEFPIATEGGVRVPDVVWITDGRREELEETGDPPTLAPELCVEVVSDSNDWDEMEEKRALYREAGAEEVWVVTDAGEVRFFADDEMKTSELAPDFPSSL